MKDSPEENWQIYRKYADNLLFIAGAFVFITLMLEVPVYETIALVTVASHVIGFLATLGYNYYEFGRKGAIYGDKA